MAIRIGTMLRNRSDVIGTVVPCVESAILNGISVVFVDGETQSLSVEEIASEWVVVEPERRIGRIVIMADMEGITGVPNEAVAVTPAEETGGVRTPEYAAACREMTLDVQMAIAGARAGGAQEIIVADAHWYDTNLLDEDFDVQVVRGSGAALQAMEGASAAMLIGWHAKAGTPKACLPHTYTDRIKRLSIDGKEVGEIGMLTRLIASYGVPVALVTGDSAACEEIEDFFAESTKHVGDDGAVVHRNKKTVRSNIVISSMMAVYNLHIMNERALTVHSPGQFEVEVFTQYQVAPDNEAQRLESGAYQIKGSDIRASYASFQRFVDRLPAIGVAPLAR